MEWQLVLPDNLGNDISLEWQKVENLPSGYRLVMRDVINGATLDLSESNRYRIPHSTQLPLGRLRVYYGPAESVSQASAAEAITRPKASRLYQNYPNPFNPQTSIPYDVSEAAVVKLEVFNVLGAKVSTLFSGVQTAGSHVAVWDGNDGSGNCLASGVYFVRLQAGSTSETRKVLLLR
jgi:hypothetical protein